MSDRAFYADGTNGSTALPQLTATRAEVVAWGQEVKPLPVTGLGAIEAINTPGVLVCIDPTPNAEVWSTSPLQVLAAVETSHTLAVSGAVDLTKRTTKLSAAAGAQTLTLGNGTYDGQEHFVVMNSAGSTAVWTLTAANLFGFSGFVMSAISHSLFVKWNSTAGRWLVMGGNCLLTP